MAKFIRPENVEEFDGYDVPEQGENTPENRKLLEEYMQKVEEDAKELLRKYKD